MSTRNYKPYTGRETYRKSAANDERFGPRVPRYGGQGPALRGVYPDSSAEVLGIAEDLWLRLARHPAIHAAVVGDADKGETMVMFRVDGAAADEESMNLLGAASSIKTYQWCDSGMRDRLVASATWCGSTLVIELVPHRVMRRWPDGESLLWRLNDLLSCISAHGGANEGA